MADHDDPLAGICGQLAAYLPHLARLTSEIDTPGFAAPGKSGRAPAAPLPGNAQAFYALTGIHAAARWAAGLLRYAVGAGPLELGGADEVTVRLLEQVIPKLATGIDDDTYSIVGGELYRRLNDALALPAIDEAQLWRWLGSARKCPRCECTQLRVALDARRRPVGPIECCTYGCKDGNGYRPTAQICADGLAWADGTVEPGIEEAALCPGQVTSNQSPSPGWTASRRRIRATRSATATAS